MHLTSQTAVIYVWLDRPQNKYNRYNRNCRVKLECCIKQKDAGGIKYLINLNASFGGHLG